MAKFPISKTRPVTPEEASNRKENFIPEFVIEAFNELIIKGFINNTVTIRQDAIIDLIKEKAGSNKYLNKDLISSEILENKWLNIEDTYRKYGWGVYYDRPGYNEDYHPTFTFTKKII